MSYEALIEDLVAGQSELLGERAVAIARGVRGLHVNADGSVDELTADGKLVVDELAASYVDEIGPPAAAAMRSVAAGYADEIDLPRRLE